MRESYDKKIYRLGTRLSLIFILLAVLGFLILLFPVIFEDYNFSELGTLGDATGGFLNPIIAIAASMLTFLAFYVQYQANKQVEKQFAKQQVDESNNFEYNKLKERINLIMNEIENFEIAFHEGKLISKLNEIPKRGGKKYNFRGIQGINLFLIEYFSDKNKKLKKESLGFSAEDSFHSIAMNINNLIVLFFNAHNAVYDSSLKEQFSSELKELLQYVYYSKLDFVVEHFVNHDPSGKLFEQIVLLKNYYRARPKI